MRTFQSLLQSFLIDYLPKRRGYSLDTITSYRDTFILLLTWLDRYNALPPHHVTMNDLSRDQIHQFADWLRTERGCATATINARIAAIRSFAKFVQAEAPEHLEICRQLLQISTIKAPKADNIDYLSVRAVELIVATAAEDIRALAIIALLYDSAARVSELCGLTIGDISFARPHTVQVLGKSRKARVIPLSAQVGQILSEYITAARPEANPTDPLFVNRSGTQLGRSGVAYVLQKHITAAYSSDPEEIPPKAHPHMMRHSKAMHLLDAGVNLIYIRDFLGHQSVITTEIYARASTQAKHRAIKSAEQNIVPESPYNNQQRADLVTWLRELL